MDSPGAFGPRARGGVPGARVSGLNAPGLGPLAPSRAAVVSTPAPGRRGLGSASAPPRGPPRRGPGPRAPGREAAGPRARAEGPGPRAPGRGASGRSPRAAGHGLRALGPPRPSNLGPRPGASWPAAPWPGAPRPGAPWPGAPRPGTLGLGPRGPGMLQVKCIFLGSERPTARQGFDD